MAIAGYGVGERIIEVGFIIIMGLGMGMATVVGHSLGAKRFSRAVEVFHTTLKISYVILALMTLTIALFREALVAFFIPRSPDVIDVGGGSSSFSVWVYSSSGSSALWVDSFRAQAGPFPSW